LPPSIAPLLVRVVIAPAFDAPAPPTPPVQLLEKPKTQPLPPLILPLLVSS